MGALKPILAAACLAISSPSQAESVADWQAFVTEASDRFGVPTAWIAAVMQAESGGRTRLAGRPIRSSAGAMGLMQLMPATWADMRVRLGLGHDPDDPRDNILAGTLYLRLMYDRFGYPGLFGAYNAGPGRYADHLAGRRKLPAETAGYLASITPTLPSAIKRVALPSPPPTIFAVRRDGPPRPEARPSLSPSSLFVVLSGGGRP